MVVEQSPLWQLCSAFVLLVGPTVVVCALVSAAVGWIAGRFGVQDAMFVAAARWLAVLAVGYWSWSLAVEDVQAFARDMWGSTTMGGRK